MSRQGTIHRYTLIIEKINRNQFPSFQEIQEFLIDCGFELSKRTIERDIEAIRNEFGVEITFDRSKLGYFIDIEKSVNIESFLRFLEIVNTAELLTNSLSESKETLNYISFDQGGGLKGIELLRPLLQATKEHRKVSFKHFNFQTKKSRKYTLSPYLLKEYQNRWYVVGVVSGIGEMRTFGVDRIEDIKVKDEFFNVDPKLNPQERFNEVIGVVYSVSEKQTVILSFLPSQGHYVKTLPIHGSQKVLIDSDEECRIEIKVAPNYELIQLILMNNDKVKVIEPSWLVEEIKGLLEETLKKYQ
jgi:predicted DNA-binding transcriptional regulator YafY